MTNSSPPSAAAEPAGDRRAFFRFVVVGAANTAISYALFVLLDLVLPYLLAYAIAYVAGIAVSYLLNTAFVFRVARSWSSAARFPLVYVLQFALGSAIVFLMVEALGMAAHVAALVAIAVTVPVSYIAMRFLLRGR